MPLVCPQCPLGPALVILDTPGFWHPGVTNIVTTQLRQTKFGLASGTTAHPRHRWLAGGHEQGRLDLSFEPRVCGAQIN